jgi:hypothetical protein
MLSRPEAKQLRREIVDIGHGDIPWQQALRGEAAVPAAMIDQPGDHAPRRALPATFRLCHNPIKAPLRRQGLFSYYRKVLLQRPVELQFIYV